MAVAPFVILVPVVPQGRTQRCPVTAARRFAVRHPHDCHHQPDENLEIRKFLHGKRTPTQPYLSHHFRKKKITESQHTTTLRMERKHWEDAKLIWFIYGVRCLVIHCLWPCGVRLLLQLTPTSVHF
jgi:hypothetical protein